MAISPDDSWLAIAGDDQTVYAAGTSSGFGRLRKQITDDRGYLFTIRWSSAAAPPRRAGLPNT